jgi:hypothetical protein
VGNSVTSTNAEGFFAFAAPVSQLGVRAPGYGRASVTDTEQMYRGVEIHLAPLMPKALYLSFYGIGDPGLRASALKLLGSRGINALVIDVKGDRGRIPYRSGLPLASETGAQKIITVRDMPDLLASLHARGIYLVARVVAFKDDPLARTHPELAVHTRNGEVWMDREGLAWTDPFRPEVQDYVIGVAEEAAMLGFDEIQFDYVRFPDTRGLVFAKPANEASRVAAISGFLARARRQLVPYNVFVAADVFGYVLWNQNDTDVGQRLEDLIPHLDYISPMLYPSGFQFGIPGFRDPLAHPYEIVNLSLRNGQKRTGLPATRFRPWLQAFSDYAFDRRVFGAGEIDLQIRAAEDFGSDGWMLWNPRNVYGGFGLERDNEK